MIKYNWEKILEITEADAGSIILIVHMLTYPRVPYNFKDPTINIMVKPSKGLVTY